MSKIKSNPNYIGCDYYGWNIENLKIAHAFKVTTSAAPNSTFLPGNIVLICASQHEGVYGFLAEAQYVYPDRVAKDIWKDFHRPDHKVTKLKVLSPIRLIPETICGDMTRAGIMKINRSNAVEFLRENMPIKTVVPKKLPIVAYIKPKPIEFALTTEPPVIVETKPKSSVIAHPVDSKPEPTLGFIYILKHSTHGFKIGITTDIKRRFTQLDVGTKASVVGTWSSDDYKAIEKHLHSVFFQERCPQSEWFDISNEQILTAIKLLNTYATCISCKNLTNRTKTFNPSIPIALICCCLFGVFALATAPNSQTPPIPQAEELVS